MPVALPRISLSSFAIVPAAILLAVVLAACQASPERQAFDPLRFDHKAPIGLDLADIRVTQTYDSPMEPPFVEHLFPEPPARAAKQWARDRLEARGERGRATFTVRHASVEEIELDTTGGLRGWLTTEPAERYEAKLEIEIAVERNGETGSTRVLAQRSTSVPEGATLNERDRIWYEMVQRMMQDLEGQLERTLSDGFAQFLS